MNKCFHDSLNFLERVRILGTEPGTRYSTQTMEEHLARDLILLRSSFSSNNTVSTNLGSKSTSLQSSAMNLSKDVNNSGEQ